jgi:hypothetical protein
VLSRAGIAEAPDDSELAVVKDETRNWGETERELLLRTDAEVVIGC